MRGVSRANSDVAAYFLQRPTWRRGMGGAGESEGFADPATRRSTSIRCHVDVPFLMSFPHDVCSSAIGA
jgi:hypothetical protein